jgi:hypothetical protein
MNFPDIIDTNPITLRVKLMAQHLVVLDTVTQDILLSSELTCMEVTGADPHLDVVFGARHP